MLAIEETKSTLNKSELENALLKLSGAKKLSDNCNKSEKKKIRKEKRV